MEEEKKKRPFASEPKRIDFHAPLNNSGYKPEYAAMLREHIGKGFSLNSFDVGVSTKTIYNWLRIHEDFALARERGEKQKLKFLEASGVKMVAEGNAAVWKTLISQYGVNEKTVTENRHHHLHEKSESADPETVVTLTGKEEQLKRIKELSERLGLMPASEVLEVEIEEGE